MSSSPAPRVPLAQAILVVPQAHYRVLDTRFQEEMYELFHRHFISRALHMICTPVIVTGLLVALAHMKLGALPIDAAIVTAAALIAYHLYADRVAGLVTAPLVMLSCAVAHRIDSHYGPQALLAAGALVFFGGLIQMFSHGAEPIPPPLSGVYGFIPVGEWFGRATPRQRVFSVLQGLMFTGLEIWAAPRVWVLQNLHLLMSAGYKPQLRAEIDARVALILTDSRHGWPGQAGLRVARISESPREHHYLSPAESTPALR